MRADELARDLHRDPKLLSSVLDGLIEKRAADIVPAEVQKIAAEIRKDIGVTEDVALKMAWQTYTTYVNPGYRREKAAQVEKVTVQKTEKTAAPKVAKCMDKKPAPKKGTYKSAEANALAKALGI